MNDDERFMRQAMREAVEAADAGEVPVGAVGVHQGRVIGRGHNQREMLNAPTAHAAMIAITAAAAASSRGSAAAPLERLGRGTPGSFATSLVTGRSRCI